MQNDVAKLDACEKFWSNSSHRQGKLNNLKWPLSKFFPGRRLLRQAFFMGIKPCDVIMHKAGLFPQSVATE